MEEKKEFVPVDLDSLPEQAEAPEISKLRVAAVASSSGWGLPE